MSLRTWLEHRDRYGYSRWQNIGYPLLMGALLGLIIALTELVRR